jgi:hypothetical protein
MEVVDVFHEEVCMSEVWSKIGEGSYNVAYKNSGSTKVLKIQKNNEDQLDTPERSVRLWNEINPNMPPPAELIQTSDGQGWVCPFVEGRQATDIEMAKGLIEIFNNTGRIITDATARKNFVTTPEGVTVCIDIGMALQLDRKIENDSRASIVSSDSWGNLKELFQPFFESGKKSAPKTINTIKALLFLKTNRPDIINADFLLEDSTLSMNLANAYDAQASLENSPLIKEALDDIRLPTLDKTKESCIEQIDRYIKSRGSLDIKDNFKPSWKTALFRNKLTTIKKVNLMKQLKSDIKNLDSSEEIQTKIKAVLKENPKVPSLYKSGVEASLNQCMKCVDINIAFEAKQSLKVNSSLT